MQSTQSYVSQRYALFALTPSVPAKPSRWLTSIATSILQIHLYYAAGGKALNADPLRRYINNVQMPAVAWYDYCLTFSREVHYVWRKRLTFISTLFYLFRYSVLLSVIPVIFITRPPLGWQAPNAQVSTTS